MATLSRILAWKIPWTEEPGGLQSMGSQRVRHNRVTSTHVSLTGPCLGLKEVTDVKCLACVWYCNWTQAHVPEAW